MKFEKALPVKMPFKASFYGKPGSGKTFTALLFAEALAKWRGGRVAFIDTERGSVTYAMGNPLRRAHPAAFDFDVIHTRSILDVTGAVRALKYPEHCVVVLDSVSAIWDAAREAWEAKNPDAKGDIPLRAWGPLKKPYKALIKFLLIESQFDVMILGREKSLFTKDEAGDLTNIGVGMRAEGETQYEPSICFHMTLEGERGEEEGTVTLFGEKDRHSVLAGRKVANPTGKTIEAYFPFLGTDVPTQESDEDRAEKDSDMLDSADKERTKEATSAGILSDMTAKVAATMTMEDLGAVTAEAKKLKRKLIETHTEALRLVFANRTAQLNQQIAGSL